MKKNEMIPEVIKEVLSKNNSGSEHIKVLEKKKKFSLEYLILIYFFILL